MTSICSHLRQSCRPQAKHSARETISNSRIQINKTQESLVFTNSTGAERKRCFAACARYECQYTTPTVVLHRFARRTRPFVRILYPIPKLHFWISTCLSFQQRSSWNTVMFNSKRADGEIHIYVRKIKEHFNCNVVQDASQISPSAPRMSFEVLCLPLMCTYSFNRTYSQGIGKKPLISFTIQGASQQKIG